MATKITGTNTAAAPGVTGDDTDTGLFYGTNEIGFSTGGTSRLTLDSSGDLKFPDSGKLKIGTGDDLQIYHDPSSGNSYITEASAKLRIASDGLALESEDNNEWYLSAAKNGGVLLAYDNSKKFETTTYGNASAGQLRVTASNATTVAFSVGDAGTGFYNTGSNAIGYSANGTQKWNIDSAGNLRLVDSVKANFGTGDDLQIYHDGSDTWFKNSHASGQTIHSAHQWRLQNVANNENMILANQDGQVELFYDGSKKLETTSSGVWVTGNAHVVGDLLLDEGDNKKIRLGDSQDLQIYHDGSNSHISDEGTGSLLIKGDVVNLGTTGGEYYFRGFENGAAYLRYDNSTKLETTANGTKVTGQQLIYQGASGGTANSGAGLTLEDNNSHYLQFLSPNNKEVGILFGDDADNDVGYITYSHTNNNLNFGTAAAERLRIDSSGKVGIGTTSPASYYANNLVVKAAANEGGITIVADATTHNNYIMFADGTSGLDRYRGLIGYQHTTNILELGADGSSVGNFKVKGDGNCEISNGDLIFAAGHGISFVNAADTASGETVSSSVLDEYEEGTWTPVLAGTTNHTLFNVSGYGTYTRVGRHVHCQVAVHNVDLNDSAGGQVMIKGLPFTEYKLSGAIRCLSCNFMTNNVGLPHSGDMNRYSWYINDSNYLVGNRSDDASGWVAWNVSNFISSSVYLDITFSYIVAS